ncbi:MAG: hypothetical protein Q4F95_14365 [Oscillospiraceae bacterium]|nr:hypothetical protein [Oscillospiraceae bacterium]
MEIFKFYEQALTELKSALKICKDSSVAIKSLTLIISGSGTFYKGCNWKKINDSYKIEDTCSEYEAITNLLLSGENRIHSIVTVNAENNAVTVPCDKCRQLIISLNPHNTNCQVVTGKNSQVIITSLTSESIINENGGFSGFEETPENAENKDEKNAENKDEKTNKPAALRPDDKKTDKAVKGTDTIPAVEIKADDHTSTAAPESAAPSENKPAADIKQADTTEGADKQPKNEEAAKAENSSADNTVSPVQKPEDAAAVQAKEDDNAKTPENGSQPDNAPKPAGDEIQLKIVEFDENTAPGEQNAEVHTSFTDSDAFNNLKLMYDNIDSENEFLDKEEMVMPNTRPFNVSSLQNNQTAPVPDQNQNQQFAQYQNAYPNTPPVNQTVNPNMPNGYQQQPQPNQMYTQQMYNQPQQNMYANPYNQPMYNNQQPNMYQQQPNQMYQQNNNMYNQPQQQMPGGMYAQQQANMYQNQQMNNNPYNNNTNPYYAAQPVNSVFMNENSGFMQQMPNQNQNQNNNNSIYTTPNVQPQPANQQTNSQYIQRMQAPVTSIHTRPETNSTSQSVYSTTMTPNDNNAIFKNRLNNILSSSSPATEPVSTSDDALKEDLLQSAKDKKKAAKIDQKFLKKAKRKGNLE